LDKLIIPSEKLYLVTDVPGYTPEISRLICMMNYARITTIESVKGLTTDELDYLQDKESNSIGALLLHIASTDNYFRVLTFEERELTEEENEKWKAPSFLGEKGRQEIKGHNLNYYLDILEEEKSIIYELLKNKNDEWLGKEIPYWNFKANIHHVWFHALEDEINHRGQIRWLRKRLEKSF
jgi:uncharacterized damage-inducible protein DinB